MATLRNSSNGKECCLLAEHLIGRSARCDLQLHETFVSSPHASIRWTGACWEVNDLGSRNGTWLEGRPIEPHGKRTGGYPLLRGAVVAFGHVDHTWSLIDDEPPMVMAIPVAGGTPVRLEGDMLAIPSSALPEVVVVRGSDGGWLIEASDGTPEPVVDGSLFNVLGAQWRFCCPNVVPQTSAAENQPTLAEVFLHFEVSADEEHVVVRAEHGPNVFHLGSRSHNYSLLTLARHRLEDSVAGLPDASCGWVYMDDLLRELAITQTQLNVEVFRIRAQFAALGFRDPAAIIERRPRTKQLRIGVRRLEVARA